MTTAEKLKQIAEIDGMFEAATGWGSWMVSAANRRERMVNELRAEGHEIAHRFQARTSSGGHVS